MGLTDKLLSIAPLRKAARRVIYGTKKAAYSRKARDIEIDDNMVVFCSFDGRSCSDSPKAVYDYMVSSGEYRDWKFVWVLNEPAKYTLDKGDTLIVKNGSDTCYEYLARAKYWILNFRAFDSWIPKEGQIYVQCWHGTPLKKLGYDLERSDNAMNSIPEIRQKYRSDAARFDYIISCCDFVTEKFRTAWDLKDDSRILPTGYPRNDRLVNEGNIEKKRYTDKKVILYAPTWRDDRHKAGKGYIFDEPIDFGRLRDELADEYIILFRAHYLIANSLDLSDYEGFIYDVSDYDDINDLYLAADILVTDYSSVFFDYALLDRPMIFYMYDMEKYREELRGFYIDLDELPGPIVRDEEGLLKALKEPKAELTDFNEKYNTMNDGKACERFCHRIFGGKQ